jgi:hypothetical protein
MPDPGLASGSRPRLEGASVSVGETRHRCRFAHEPGMLTVTPEPALTRRGASGVSGAGLAGITSASYCEDMGYFGSERPVCYDSLGLGSRMAGLYAAAGIGLSELLARPRSASSMELDCRPGGARGRLFRGWCGTLRRTAASAWIPTGRSSLGSTPVPHARQSPQIVKPDVVARIKRVYALSDPGCEQ